MKEGIHPEYKDAKVTCACGASYETRSSAGNFSVEVCANCHPFYTGKQKLLDTKGRVDKFNRKYGTKTVVAPDAAAPEAAAKLGFSSFSDGRAAWRSHAAFSRLYRSRPSAFSAGNPDETFFTR